MLSSAATNDPAMTGQVKYDRIKNEFYATPSKFVGCVAEHIDLSEDTWWEPCAGQGHIALEVERLVGGQVICSDLVKYEDHPERKGFTGRVFVYDFLKLDSHIAMAGDDEPYVTIAPSGIITNPPYITFKVDDPEYAEYVDLAYKYDCVCPRTKRVSMAELFLRHAIALMEPVQGKVLMYLRHEFDCASGRLDLFQTHPAYAGKVVVTERPRWIEGSTGSPRHNYSWFCFDWKHNRDMPFAAYSHPATAKPITIQ